MAFIKEKLTPDQGAEQREKFNLSNPLNRNYKNAEPISPRARAIDTENDAVVFGVGQGRGAFRHKDNDGPGIYYDLFWQGKRTRAIMQIDTHNGTGIISWVFNIIFVPKSLEAKQEKAVELIKAGIACLEEPFEHEKEKYTYEGFVGPDPVVVVEDDEVEDKV